MKLRGRAQILPPPQPLYRHEAFDRQIIVSRVSHHLLLCATPTKALCCPDPELGAASWARLKQLVRDLGLEDPAREQGIVLRGKADCLRICAEGPILLIWPDGVVYGGVSAERIEPILRQHVIGGVPIEDWVVARHQFGGRQQRSG
jgi:(2Fe-2S) ferredoxin